MSGEARFLGWVCAALAGPAIFIAVWIYCAVTYGFVLGFRLGWIPALILALLIGARCGSITPDGRQKLGINRYRCQRP